MTYKSFLVLNIIFLQIILKSSSALRPNFVSDWKFILAGSHASTQTIKHNLGEYPAKVDVQVKVKDQNEDYIFTGFGSAHRDDDCTGDPYGAVIYYYNTDDVIVRTPTTLNGMCAYTGGSYYNGSGSIGGSYPNCHVRVRVWTSDRLGIPLFDRSGITVDVNNNKFKEIHHNLNEFPDIVSVQLLFGNGYISDAQGNVFSGVSYEINYNNFGGVIYGYDSSRIRLWTPNSTREYGGVFSASDGWGDPKEFVFRSGTVRIRMWKVPSDWFLFSHTLTPFGVGVGGSTYEVVFSRPLDLAAHLLSVTVAVQTADNLHFRFNAAGSCQATGVCTLQRPFGAVVYVYNSYRVLLYVPKLGSGGHLVYVGGYWGDGTHKEIIDKGSLVLTVTEPRISDSVQFTKTATDVFKVGDELFEGKARSGIECAKDCLKNNRCQSFSYHKSLQTCRGHDKIYQSHALQPGQGHKYYSLPTFF